MHLIPTGGAPQPAPLPPPSHSPWHHYLLSVPVRLDCLAVPFCLNFSFSETPSGPPYSHRSQENDIAAERYCTARTYTPPSSARPSMARGRVCLCGWEAAGSVGRQLSLSHNKYPAVGVQVLWQLYFQLYFSESCVSHSICTGFCSSSTLT